MTPALPSGELDDQWLAAALQRFAVSRDQELRNEIAARTSWLAMRSARRFWDRGEPFDDLVQVAQVGLLKAIDRFDPAAGVHFAVFATPTIVGEVRRHFRDHTWSMHVPRRAKELRAAANAVRDDLARELQRAPRIDELAARLHVPADQVIEALESNHAYRPQVFDPLAASGPTRSTVDFDTVLDRDLLATLLDRLPARERRILILRYFGEMTQEQIAAQMGTSQVHIGRLIRASLEQLRQSMPDGRADSV